MRPGCGAVLVPAVSTTAWEQGLGCRAAVFRDWGWNDDDGKAVDDVRLVQVIKAEGIALPEGRARVVGFSVGEVSSLFFHVSLKSLANCPRTLEAECIDISQNGLNPLDLPSIPTFDPSRQKLPQMNPTATLTLPQKRKISATDLEVPDSEGEDDEDYGWAEEDEEDVPVMPPQWQGSEDILIPPPGELEAEDPEDEHEEVPGNGKELPEEIVDSEDELAL